MRVRRTLISAGLVLATSTAAVACSGDDDSATTSVAVDITNGGGDSGEVTTTIEGASTTVGESFDVTTTVPPTTKPGQTTTTTKPAPTTTTLPPTTVVIEGDERPPGIPQDLPLPDGEQVRAVESEASYALLFKVGNAENAAIDYHQALVEAGWAAGDIVQAGSIEDFAAGFTATKGAITINVNAGENLAEGDDGILLSILGL